MNSIVYTIWKFRAQGVAYLTKYRLVCFQLYCLIGVTHCPLENKNKPTSTRLNSDGGLECLAFDGHIW